MPLPASSSMKGLDQQVERVNINNRQEQMYNGVQGEEDAGSEFESTEEEVESALDAERQEILHNQIAEMPRSAAHMKEAHPEERREEQAHENIMEQFQNELSHRDENLQPHISGDQPLTPIQACQPA